MANEKLQNLTLKSSLANNDLMYVADSENAFASRKTTLIDVSDYIGPRSTNYTLAKLPCLYAISREYAESLSYSGEFQPGDNPAIFPMTNYSRVIVYEPNSGISDANLGIYLTGPSGWTRPDDFSFNLNVYGAFTFAAYSFDYNPPYQFTFQGIYYTVFDGNFVGDQIKFYSAFNADSIFASNVIACSNILSSFDLLITNQISANYLSNNTILASIGNVITSLNTDVYPNFTELSYLKGVTNPIQEQIDSLSGSLIWNDITTTNQSISPNNGYISHSATQTTFTLPVTCALGKMFTIIYLAPSSGQLLQNEGQTIIAGDLQTSPGTSGRIANIDFGDVLTVICTATNTEFVVIGSIGNASTF